MGVDVKHAIVVRDKAAFLAAMMAYYSGDARICIEGNLLQSKLLSHPSATTAESPPLHRNTLSPLLDFIIFPLNDQTLSFLLKALMPHGTLAHKVIHVMIERTGKLGFVACDSFHPECVWAMADSDFIEKLRRSGVIRAFTTMPAAG